MNNRRGLGVRHAFWGILVIAIFLFSPNGQQAKAALAYPQLPTATVDVTCCAPVTRSVAVHTAAQLQAALDDATLGDEIVLDAGKTYEGNFVLRVPSGTVGWVTIRTSDIAALPPPGTRVSLADAPHMAKIMSPNAGDPGAKTYPAIGNFSDNETATSAAIHNYRFIGIEFATGLTNYNYHVIFIAPQGGGVPYSEGTMPHDIIIDRSLIHGNDPITTTFPDGAAALNGSALFSVANGAIVDSKIYNLWGIGLETQAISCDGAPGPLLIQNNEISGGTESFMCGGALLPYSDKIPTDITIVHNYINHPAAWKTSSPIVPYVKNLFELKVGERVRFTDNLLEGNWDRGGGQRGYAITITPRPYQDSGSGVVPAIYNINQVSDVLIANNVVRNVGGFVSTGLYDGQCVQAGVNCVQSARLMVSDSMVDSDDSNRYDGSTTPLGEISASGMQDFSVKRNTFLGHDTAGGNQPNPALWGNRGTCAGTFGTNFEWSYNINLNGTWGDCTYDPTNILITSWLGTDSVTSNLAANLIPTEQTAWNAFGHASQIAATEADIKLSADELTLQPSSPYYGMGIGANLGCFNEAAIRAGTPSSLCPLPPEVNSGSGGNPPPVITPPSDIITPTVSITSPANGSVLTGNTSIAVSASDNIGVTKVELYVDGSLSGTDTTSPYTFSLNTASLSNGSHTLSVKAYDAVGNIGISTTVTITASNTVVTPPPTSTSQNPPIQNPTSTQSSGGGSSGGSTGGSSFSLTSVTVSSITGTSAVVTIVSNNPASFQARYGKTTSYSGSSGATQYLTTAYVNLTGLTPGTAYDLQIIAAPQASKSLIYSSNYVFQTTGSATVTPTTPVTTNHPTTPTTPTYPTTPSTNPSTPTKPNTSGIPSNTGTTGIGTTSGSASPIFTRPLAYGSTGNDVLSLQSILRFLGYLPSTFNPTLYLGSITQHALLLFQRDHQLNKSGYLDIQSESLFNKIANANPSFLKGIIVSSNTGSFSTGAHIETLANLKVRNQANTNGSLLGTQGVGAFGTITGGPVSQGGYTWWQIVYDTGVSGWSVQSWMQVVR